MNTILLSELKAIMALLETMPRIPAPVPVLAVRVDVPESEIWDAFPYKDEEFAAWLEYEWEQTEEEDIECGCGPGTPIYEYYMENRLYPKLLEAGYHYINGLQTEDDEAARLLLNEEVFGLGLLYNIIADIPQPDEIDLDALTCEFGFTVGEAMVSRIYGFVDAMFNYDLLNARRIAFDYGGRLRLYACTQQGWVVTQLGQTVRSLPDAEAAAFLLILEAVRAVLDQDDWFVSHQRLQWLLDECPVRFDLRALDEESQFVEKLKKDDRWLRRLRWLGIVTYTHDCKPYEAYVIAFNSRVIKLTPSGRATIEAILASWDHKPGRPSILSLVDSIRLLGSPLSPQTAILEELGHILKALGDLHVLVSALRMDFKRVQHSFERQLNELTDEAQRDAAYQQAYEELHQLVVRSLAQEDDRIREYERRLAKRLGEVWYQLGLKSQHFLSSAEYLYSEHRGANFLDFAPAAVEYCKVVEKELGERLSRPLMQHTGKTARPLTLGQLAHRLEATPDSKDYQTMRDFLSSRYLEEAQGFILQDLPDKLRKITTEYRNGSAHTEALSQEKVEEFRVMLLGSEDNVEPSLLQQIVLIQPTSQ